MSTETFADRLRRIRDKRVYSQTDLAARSGLSRVHLNRLEQGATQHPTEQTIRALAAALDVSPEWLRTGTRLVR